MLPQGADMTLDKQVTAKLAFEPGDKKKLEEIWLGVHKTIVASFDKKPKAKVFEVHHSIEAARSKFFAAYLEHGINGPLATKALAAVGL